MKKTVATGLMTGLAALGAAAVTRSATAKTDSYSSCYGDHHGISSSSDYYWRRWQLPRQNRSLRLLLLLQQRLRRLMKNIGGRANRSACAASLRLAGGNSPTDEVYQLEGQGSPPLTEDQAAYFVGVAISAYSPQYNVTN
jgi:hypothetical protein